MPAFRGLGGIPSALRRPCGGTYGRLYGRQGKPSRWPTDWQAEVLYPHELPCEHLRQIYTQLGETEDSVRGVLGGLDLTVKVSHEPEVFA